MFVTVRERTSQIGLKKAIGAKKGIILSEFLMESAFLCVIGGLIGALTYVAGGLPISLSTSGGALLAGLVLGYLRTIRPTFGNIPGPALWLMNTLGLNVFIAIVGISAGPGFVSGLQQVGLNPRRTGLLHVLRAMGADIAEEHAGEQGGEPVCDLRVRHAPLHGIEVPEALVPDLPEDFAEPLCLLARAIAFDDPVTGQPRHFASRRTLAWPAD